MRKKTCCVCGELKTIKQFSKNRNSKDGFCARCKDCDHAQSKDYYNKHKKERLHYNKSYYSNNRERYRELRYLNRYGIGLDEYDVMYKKQNGVCAICGLPEERYSHLLVDHDHATGKVRALLCSKCNNAIGFCRENVVVLKNIIKYLRQHTI